MRKISLETFDMGKVGVNDLPPLPMGAAVTQILENKEGGFTLPEVRQVNRIIKAIETAGKASKDSVLLEDPDWAYLKSRLETHKFPFAHSAFERMADLVNEAEIVDPNAQ